MAALDDGEDLFGGRGDEGGVGHGEEDLLDGVGPGEVAGDLIRDEDGLVGDFGLAEGFDAFLEDADDDEGDAADGDAVVNGGAGAAEEGDGEGSDDDGDLGVGAGILIVKEAAGEDRQISDFFVLGETPRIMVSLVMPPPIETRSWISAMGEEAMMPGTCSVTASMSSRVMESGVLVLSGPAMEPPLYCISTMFGPMEEMRVKAY